MKLSELKKGEIGIVKKVNAKEPLKSRLLSFEITKNQKIKVLEYTLAKNTFEVEVDNTKVALREEEASQIEVIKEEKWEKLK